MRYRVRATIRGKRILTDKYWNKRKLAQKYADETNKNNYHARARVIKIVKGKNKKSLLKSTFGIGW